MSVECPKCRFDNPDDTVYCGKCATLLKPSENIPEPTKTIEAPKEELTTGSTFAGRYQIIEKLGEGGMGIVYKAKKSVEISDSWWFMSPLQPERSVMDRVYSPHTF